MIIRDLPIAPSVAAQSFSSLPGVVGATPCYDVIGLYFERTPCSLSDLEDALTQTREKNQGRAIQIPVCYELAEDLDEASEVLGISGSTLVDVHSDREYRCEAVGFSPGFAYLAPLHERISVLPRRKSPRPRVEPGSVAIAGSQTAIYPQATPGGWWLIGRCPLCLVDVKDDYFPIQVGDSVKFFAIDPLEFDRLRGERL